MLGGQADDLVQALAHRGEVRADVVHAAEVRERQRGGRPARDDVHRLLPRLDVDVGRTHAQETTRIWRFR